FQAEDGIRDRNVTGVQTCAVRSRIEVGQLEALDGSRDHALKMSRHTRRGHLFDEDGIEGRLLGDEPDVRRIALVAGPGMRELDQPSLHARTSSTAGSTMRLSMSAG